jgi:5-(carboxyamino)imidazole ribonucleotide synthase
MHHRALNRKKLGVLGGGQLGQLLYRQALQWGVPALLYEGTDWRDEASLRAFISQVDVVLLENEFVDPALLEGVTCYPSLPSYRVFRDKLLEKQLALSVGIETPRFVAVQTLGEVREFMNLTPAILKSRTGGYDGYGNLSLTAHTADSSIQRFLEQGPCIVEERVDFRMEVAVLVARGHSECVTFPVAETIQHDHICREVIVPARLPAELLREITNKAKSIVAAATGVGIFGVEFFVTDAAHVLYNETAPRPHNSAHFTLDACPVSQYGALVQLAQDLPLRTPHLTTPAVGMMNLLGTAQGTGALQPLAPFLQQGSLWMYGKKESRPGRKMGHFTLCGNDPSEILAHFQTLKEYQV